VWRVYERFGQIPPGFGKNNVLDFDTLTSWQKAQLFGYEQIRQMEFVPGGIL